MITAEQKQAVRHFTNYTVGQLQGMPLPERIAVQKDLEAKNYHTEILIVDAVVQGKDKVLQGLLTVAEFHAEFGTLNEELHNFRNWLATLLA